MSHIVYISRQTIATQEPEGNRRDEGHSEPRLGPVRDGRRCPDHRVHGGEARCLAEQLDRHRPREAGQDGLHGEQTVGGVRLFLPRRCRELRRFQ